MRVMHVAPTAFGPSGLLGGGERYPLELARALAQHVSCELLTFGKVASEYRVDKLRVRVLRPAGYLHGHPAHPLSSSLPRAIGSPDIVHVHQMRSVSSMLAAAAARVRRIPTAVTDHGLQAPGWTRLAPSLFDRFLTVSGYSATELRAPPAKVRLIYGGADPRRYWPDLTLRRDGVLFVGRLTPHKGVDRLIQALPSGAKLTVVGSAGHDRRIPERDYPALLRRLASGRQVRFTGGVADDDLAQLYRSAIVLVLPSVALTCYGRPVAVSELLGLVVLEAMASGTPVIASRIGGLPEIVADGVTGYLVDPGDERAITDRLRLLLDNPQTAARMGRAARERVLAELTWDHCAARCLTEYESLVNDAGRAVEASASLM